MAQKRNNLSPSTRRPFRQPNKAALSQQKKGPFGYLAVLALILLAMSILQGRLATRRLSFDELLAYIKQGKVERLTIGDTEITGRFRRDATVDGYKPGSDFKVNFKPEIGKERLNEVLADPNTAPHYEFEQERFWLIFFMNYIFPMLVIAGLIYFLFVRNLRAGPGGILMSFGRSRHRLHSNDSPQVTFKDVAGIDEAKEEVAEIIEFLKNPQKFQRLGGRIPRGVLLVGPPGCGKTLLAKAIAGEADVPFFSISGSDFVEMFVGVGASRVRDLFKQAKEHSPCIIFLDEIDAIGRKRGASFVGGGHDEREQTLNAILVEMDGFDSSDQVIVIAATNRADILDHALTRPGRFDRQVVVPLPDIKGRLEILKVHAKKVKLGPDVDLERLARATPMFSGADLAAIINEAALAATMANKDYIEMVDLEEARDKVRWGRAKKSRVIDQKEKEITAYHEAAHALVQCLLPDADPLHKVSIIPRGPMGGATFALPEKDRTLFTKKYCMALLQVCFAGRIAEGMIFEDISSGAQSDIEQATRIAKQMVLTWGMSERLGPISYGPDLGVKEAVYALPFEKDYSDKTAEQIDQEIRHLIEQAYNSATQLLLANRDKLEALARALLKYETLDAVDVKTIISGGTIDRPTVTDLLAAERAKAGSPGTSS
ncbi:MAG: ATP-dependent zinc metalloprotease FtsH [Sedimentisphaerales bacterium]|nr:ATP-dependent zinc metalloprotease FtsH [Sedimentisphaerales bacterium]